MYSTSDFLINHAYKHVWCAPTQDRQYIVSPERLTSRRGTLGGLKVGMRYINLPTQSDLYHVFVFGDLPPMMVGMDTVVDTWISAKNHCNRTSLLIDVYTSSGIHLPLHRTFFLYDRSGHLVVAVMHTPRCASVGDEALYFRWRSNAWFDGQNSLGTPDGIEVDGATIASSDDLYTWQVRLQGIRQRQGGVFIFVNGRRVRDLSILTVAVGDVIEYVYDGSIREVRELPLKDLLSFDSVLDGCGKFLVPSANIGDTIDYLDDVDFYVLKYSAPALYSGYFYHRNQPNAIRMVTHRDYALNSAYLLGTIGDHGWVWDDNIRVEVTVRNAGLIRELVDEHHRIKELFKLPEALRLGAMIGENSGVGVWSAHELERSDYLSIMRTPGGTLQRSVVENAYGYNAVSKLINDTPVKLPANRTIDVPHASRSGATFFEYDQTGKLIGWNEQAASLHYIARDPRTAYVEVYPGKGGVGLCSVYDDTGLKLKEGIEYRFYVCPKNGTSIKSWIDVTGDDRYYALVNKVVVWKIDRNNFHTAIRNDRDFLLYATEIDYVDDLLVFTIQSDRVSVGSIPTAGVMEVPPGEVDVFLNGSDLIEGIDYYIDWPAVGIVTKNHLNPGRAQQVVIRGRGFCKSDMSRDRDADYGFVDQGRLSRNGRFHVRDDRVSRISIGGSLYLRDEVVFSEDGSIATHQEINGYPYRIHHPIIPLSSVGIADTYLYRQRSHVVDGQVEDYLTQLIPESADPTPNPIVAHYKVFSPLCSKLIYDMLRGVLLIDEFKGEYSLDTLRRRLRGYDWILPFDPAVNGVDERYVVIHPHAEIGKVGLNTYQYRLLHRAVEVMLKGNVELNRHIDIVPEGSEYPNPYNGHIHFNDEV